MLNPSKTKLEIERILMKLLLALLILGQAHAANLSCSNTDDYWQEDSLEFIQEGSETSAYYFDNDSYYTIPCESTARDGYLCNGSGFTVRFYESGEAIVESSLREEVDFYCY